MALLNGGPRPRSKSVYIFKPTTSTDTFSGLDSRGYNLSYTVGEGFVNVIVNGIQYAPTMIQATDGFSVKILEGIALAGDTIVIETEATDALANSYTKTEVYTKPEQDARYQYRSSPCFAAYGSAAAGAIQTVNPIPYATTLFNNGGRFNGSRFTADQDGYYRFAAGILASAASNGNKTLNILKAGVTTYAAAYVNGAVDTTMVVSCVIPLSVGEWVVVGCIGSLAGSFYANGAASTYHYFNGEQVG